MRGRFSNKFHFHTICGICSSLSTEEDPRTYFDLDDFVDEYLLQFAVVNLLIGQDYYWEILQLLVYCQMQNYQDIFQVYFMLESLGIHSISHEAEIYSVLDQMALDHFKQSVKFDRKCDRYMIEEDR
ncbi:unnamed protein product [Lepeophtheirus salmonis]|uniref:(salmon louse) hypothetical protein n=1 Tax=Lepeophtheirus salmonis TaxID=72036 RepID=A0A7R8D6B5_LEPSM|nr:unnamed protein product [Lepeophtheirus salmonis]CAF3043649.1 unnamed protein product [Lepeophtheirus salmonis]